MSTGLKRTMPVGDVLVGDAGGDVKHDDAALAVDVVAITQAAKLLLAGRVPDVELDLTKVLRAVSALPSAGRSSERTYGGEAEGMNLDTEGGHVLLFEFTRQVALDKGGLKRALSSARQAHLGAQRGRR